MFGTALRDMAKGSRARMKRTGDRGQPYLVPLEMGNGSDKQPA